VRNTVRHKSRAATVGSPALAVYNKKSVYLERRRGGVSVHVAINPFPAFGQLVAAGLAAVAVAERGVKRNADLLHRGYETERETERARVRIRECDSEKIGHRKVTRPTERASDRER
jgi:hypothetical protein